MLSKIKCWIIRLMIGNQPLIANVDVEFTSGIHVINKPVLMINARPKCVQHLP